MDFRHGGLSEEAKARLRFIAENDPKYYDDGGYSGSNMQRPGLQQLMDDIRHGLINVVVVYRLDRLSRSLHDFGSMQLFFEENNVGFSAVTQELNTTTSTGRMMLNIIMTFAQFERETTVERIRDKMSAARKRGQYVGGSPPFGYYAQDRKLHIKESEATIVRKIFNRFLELKDLKALMLELNHKNIHVRSQRPWPRNELLRLLTNRQYIGEIIHHDEIYKSQAPGLLSLKTWNEVQQIISETLPSIPAKTNQESLAPLRKLLRCGHCKAMMSATYTMKNTQRYEYCFCLQDSKRSVKICPVRHIPAKEIEIIVLEQLVTLLCIPEFMDFVEHCMGEEVATIIMRNLSAEELRRQLNPSDMIRLIQLLVESLSIRQDRIDMTLKTAVHAEALRKGKFVQEHIKLTAQKNLSITIPVQMRKWCSQKIVAKPDDELRSSDLSAAIARAFYWQELLDSGKVKTVDDLALKLRLNRSYVSRILRLNELAPDIIETILDNGDPHDFTIYEVRQYKEWILERTAENL